MQLQLDTEHKTPSHVRPAGHAAHTDKADKAAAVKAAAAAGAGVGADGVGKGEAHALINVCVTAGQAATGVQAPCAHGPAAGLDGGVAQTRAVMAARAAAAGAGEAARKGPGRSEVSEGARQQQQQQQQHHHHHHHHHQQQKQGEQEDALSAELPPGAGACCA